MQNYHVKRLLERARKKNTPYDSSRALAQGVEALSEHNATDEARNLVRECQQKIRSVTPRSSQASALGLLARAATWLGRDVARAIIGHLARVQRQDDYYRISMELIDALGNASEDRDFVVTIANSMKGARYRRKALMRIHGVPPRRLQVTVDRVECQHFHEGGRPISRYDGRYLDTAEAIAASTQTAFASAVTNARIAERHANDGDAERAILAAEEARKHAQRVDEVVPRSHALQTVFNYVLAAGQEPRRRIVRDLVALHRSNPIEAVEESVIAALTTLVTRRHQCRIVPHDPPLEAPNCDDSFVDDILASIEPETTRERAMREIATARSKESRRLPPTQTDQQERAYHCETIDGECQLIYAALRGPKRRWNHEWRLRWCHSAKQCGVVHDDVTDWRRCEHAHASELTKAKET